jgi:DNA-binding NtrC family response regulator
MRQQAMSEALTVLIIEDDPDVALGCEQALQLDGISAACVGSAEQARRRLGRDFRGIIVSDIRLPKMDGMAFLRETLALDPELPVVLITGHGDVSMAVQAMKDGAYDFIQKPFPPEYLVEVVRRALEKRRLVLEVRDLRRQLEQRDQLEGKLIGLAPSMQKLRAVLVGLASSAADVLIHGETGTGKELVARCLHEASSRAPRQFCGDQLRRAAGKPVRQRNIRPRSRRLHRRCQTADRQDRAFASGGTLFLDEIESMPTDDADQTAARLTGKNAGTPWLQHHHSHRLPRHRRNQGRSARTCRAWRFPQRSLLPAKRRHARPAPVA